LKTNITLLLPLNTYKKRMGKLIASKLHMLYADVEALLQYELDIKKALDVNGKDYLERQENKLVKRVASYSNTLIVLPFDTFIRQKNIEVLKQNSLVVYLQLLEKNYLKILKRENTKEKFLLESKTFKEKDKLLKNYSDVVVKCENANKKDILKAFLKEVNNYYTKKGNS